MVMYFLYEEVLAECPRNDAKEGRIFRVFSRISRALSRLPQETLKTQPMQTCKTRVFKGIAAACALFAGLTVPAIADTHYVATNGWHIAPYTNWPTAATNIQDAVNAASNGDEVLVTNGMYVLSSQILITNGITVRGVNGAANTTVDGNNSNRCFTLTHNNAVVKDLTITRGWVGDYGGGVDLWNGSRAENCVIVSNTSVTNGGGVSVCIGSSVQDCLIMSNSAGVGGGVYCIGQGYIQNCTISGNQATNSDGGGVYFYFGGGVMEDCLIAGNTAESWGGGVVCRWGGTVRNCTISGNSAKDAFGGVRLWDGGTVENCTITQNCATNTAGDAGGGGMEARH